MVIYGIKVLTWWSGTHIMSYYWSVYNRPDAKIENSFVLKVGPPEDEVSPKVPLMLQ